MKYILDLFFVLVGTAHSLTLDLGYDFVNVTSRSQKELGYDNLFRVENIDMGSAVIVSIRNIPGTTPNADVRAQAVLRVVNTNDQTRIRAPLLVEKGQVVVTLEKGLWENAFVDLYVVGRDLPEISKRGRLLTIDLSTYVPVPRNIYFENASAEENDGAKNWITIGVCSFPVLSTLMVAVFSIVRKRR
jgi:hypothetical protein